MGKNKLKSETVKGILTFFGDAEKDYKYGCEQWHKMDQLTQDYLHQLELEDLKYEQRAKVATQLALCRKERRSYKNESEILEPLVQFLGSNTGKQMMKELQAVLGQMRRIEKNQAVRSYYPRVLDTPKGQ